MRYLGIDYGTKRIGIALSDQGGRVAFPKKVIANRGGERAVTEIKTIIEREKVSEIVVGLPVSLDGRETEIMKEARHFAEILQQGLSIPVHLENEMLTTHMAKRDGIKKEHIDEAAAALILQAYLDKQNRAER
ncbi:MAG: Holliday junction resolvase RuvX [Candidatus Sungbacteria bacterium]|nr:Holliday junction resolvase RuvX [Candidatus Sungbacteria bacterium]